MQPLPKLIVYMPALNEEETISSTIEAVPKTIPGIASVMVLVVDDGSSDRTSERATQSGARVFRHPINMGVGAAFQSAVQVCLELRADIMVSIDADGQFDPLDIPKLIAPVLSGQADFVTASRFLEKEYYPKGISRTKFAGNHMMSFLVSVLTSKSFKDVSCGYRAYSRECLLRLNVKASFTYTQETFLDLSFKKIRIAEVPVHVKYFENRVSRVANSITKYALRTSSILLRSLRDYRPMMLFGWTSILFGLLAIVLFLPVGINLFETGNFTPYKSFAFVAGFFGAAAFVCLLFGFFGQLLSRIRIDQELSLYLTKKILYGNSPRLQD